MPAPGSFTALVLEEDGGKVRSSIKTLNDDALPDHEVSVAVAYSSLNYKDGMVLNGLGGLVNSYPHVPGIDLAGVVESSGSPCFKPGDKVMLTGWRVGEAYWGGYSTRVKVKAEWLVSLPSGLSLEQSMAIGTAGFTAMMAVMALEDHGLKPGNGGEVLVTGAGGGVGSIAVALLSALGYRVAAATGRADNHDYLRELGAHVIVERAELEIPPKGPLGKTRWAGAVDSVGGSTLAHVLATLEARASCASVGLVAGAKLETTVIPFLLRGVNLLGMDSSACPFAHRVKIWSRLASDLPLDKLKTITSIASLAQVAELGGKILHGEVRGRIVIDVGKER
ncbi:MAG: acryloyl-CoA reductase [Rhodospirillales bacterium RIFCSPLOWO2_12_FULL_58_28]|nr:MAG: acryloyl-CoA reductase [Rhodospirillales bacterium RIFCSPLOWO2_02_FULL_58_16]OHC79624.1 MAG: acryloyl-CoA reductase [Rhodospirillales bacterium RIFCSPLOWO2_12_FULL_58_28]